MLLTRPELLCAWRGESVLVVDNRGDCGDNQPLSGFYFRETRFLRHLRLEIDGDAPWLCERADPAADALAFVYNHPELTVFGGGGTGQGDDHRAVNAHGIAYRSLDLRVAYVVRLTALEITVLIANRARERAELELGWAVGADYADLQEAESATRTQEGTVGARCDESALHLNYQHPALPYATVLRPAGPSEWRITPNRLTTHLDLESQTTARLTLSVLPVDFERASTPEEDVTRAAIGDRWRASLVRIEARGNHAAEAAITANVGIVATLPLLAGPDDEALALQAGIPRYPALFARDALTAGWQAAMIDRGEALDAALTRLGRLQGTVVDAWRDEEPGRIVQQVRSGPLARLGLNPFARYYGDFAGPLMYVVALAHLYAWTGERAGIARHWDTARRILDWARDYGDRDGDGYLEYHTQSPAGPKNQGWKDSGDAVLYSDGSPVPLPIATCELQGYWFAAQQLMAILSWAMGSKGDARAHRRSAADLKDRFNRDWWLEDEGCVALAMDPDKRPVPAVTSNAGHCLASGIVSDTHLPRLAGRLFAPDMFSGWGIRTLSTRDATYNPLSYHRGSVWAAENATIAFGLRRFGFDTRAVELARGLLELSQLYPGHCIPECVGGYARGERDAPGAYPRANTPQLWNASAFPLLVHTILGLQPVGPLDLLVIDPVLPTWLPEIVLHDLRLGGATATIRFWRDTAGNSHGEIVRRRGTLHLVHQPPVESLTAGAGDRFKALADSLLHH